MAYITAVGLARVMAVQDPDKDYMRGTSHPEAAGWLAGGSLTLASGSRSFQTRQLQNRWICSPRVQKHKFSTKLIMIIYTVRTNMNLYTIII